jgi:hypothetical protein
MVAGAVAIFSEGALHVRAIRVARRLNHSREHGGGDHGGDHGGDAQVQIPRIGAGNSLATSSLAAAVTTAAAPGAALKAAAEAAAAAADEAHALALRSGFKVSARHIVDGAHDFAVTCKSQRLLLLCAGGDMLKVFALHRHSHSYWKNEATTTASATGAAVGGATPAPAAALAPEEENSASRTFHAHADTVSPAASADADAASAKEDAEDGCVQLKCELFCPYTAILLYWHKLVYVHGLSFLICASSA